jgi:hypothetical protein
MVMSNKYLEDGQGNASSKRLAGVISLGIGGLMGITLFILAILTVIKDPSTATSVMNGFLIAGSSLLGIGVLEGVVKK